MPKEMGSSGEFFTDAEKADLLAGLARLLRGRFPTQAAYRRATGVSVATARRHYNGEIIPEGLTLLGLLRQGILSPEDLSSLVGGSPGAKRDDAETGALLLYRGLVARLVADGYALDEDSVRRRLGFDWRHLVTQEERLFIRTLELRDLEELRGRIDPTKPLPAMATYVSPSEPLDMGKKRMPPPEDPSDHTAPSNEGMLRKVERRP